jgi:hypothetical protein
VFVLYRAVLISVSISSGLINKEGCVSVFVFGGVSFVVSIPPDIL